MKLAFADAYRYVSDPRTMTVTPAQLLDRGYLAARARRIDRQRGAGFPAWHAADCGHRLPDRRRRERNDGVADPVELHGLRVGHRRARNRHQPAEPRHRLFARSRATPTWSVVASGRITRSFPDSSRRDGAPYASFGVMGGAIQPQAHLQTLVRLIDYHAQSAGGPRRAALESQRRTVDRSRGRGVAATACRTRRARSRVRVDPGLLHGFRRGTVHRAQR